MTSEQTQCNPKNLDSALPRLLPRKGQQICRDLRSVRVQLQAAEAGTAVAALRRGNGGPTRRNGQPQSGTHGQKGNRSAGPRTVSARGNQKVAGRQQMGGGVMQGGEL